MTRYAESMAEIIRQHGGTVERFRGDEVMAVFGVPVAHEDDALRAVRTATEMQRHLAELNTELKVERGASSSPAGSASTRVKLSPATPARARGS